MSDDPDPRSMDPALASRADRSAASPGVSCFATPGVGAGSLGLGGVPGGLRREAARRRGWQRAPNAASGLAETGGDKQTLDRQLNFANWDYYIDVDSKGNTRR